MSHGHLTGTKKESPGASDWYREVESETLRQLDAEADTRQEVSLQGETTEHRATT